MGKRLLSIWLRPSAEQSADLATLIRRLAGEHATTSFPPHVTVVGDTDRLCSDSFDALTSVAHRTSCLQLTALSLKHTSAYHKCVFFVCEAVPALLELRATCAQLLEYDITSVYQPHLSAIYGHLPTSTRTQIAGQLASLLPLGLDLSYLSIVDTTGNDPRYWNELHVPIHLLPCI
jgi:Cyclic phosphodiesterase-like protein